MKLPANPPNREADVHVNADLLDADGNSVLRDIPCKVYLPQRPTEMPYLQFQPTSSVDELAKLAEFQFRAFVSYSSVETDELWCRSTLPTNVSTRFRGAHVYDRTFDGVPLKLFRVHTYGSRGTLGSNVVFRVSSNKLLNRPRIITRKPNGTTSVREYDQHTYQLTSDTTVSFDNQVREVKSSSLSASQTLLETDLVALVASKPLVSLDEIETTIRKPLDDFLLMVSLATECRTGCLGWRYIDATQTAEEFSGNFGLPDGTSEGYFHHGLAGREGMEHCIAALWTAFLGCGEQSLIRRAVWTLVPGTRRPSSHSFLTKFAVLDGLLQAQSKRTPAPGVLDEREWHRLSSLLRLTAADALDFMQTSGEAEKVQEIIQRLKNLNRPTLRNSAAACFGSLQIRNDDLWPLFGTRSDPGLYQVRNLLTHGFQVTPQNDDAIFVAEHHLHWMVLRLLLSFMGVEIHRTAVGFNYETETVMKMETVQAVKRLILH